MSWVSRIVWCIGLCLVPLAAAGAQLPEIQPGARIRLKAPGDVSGRAVGTVVGRTADSLTFVRKGSAQQTVALANITRLEVSRGMRRARGLALGMVAGGLIGSSSGDDFFCGDGCRRYDRRTIVVGALLGAGFGALIGDERWERIGLPGRVSIAPASRAVLTVQLPVF